MVKNKNVAVVLIFFVRRGLLEINGLDKIARRSKRVGGAIADLWGSHHVCPSHFSFGFSVGRPAPSALLTAGAPTSFVHAMCLDVCRCVPCTISGRFCSRALRAILDAPCPWRCRRATPGTPSRRLPRASEQTRQLPFLGSVWLGVASNISTGVTLAAAPSALEPAPARAAPRGESASSGVTGSIVLPSSMPGKTGATARIFVPPGAFSTPPHSASPSLENPVSHCVHLLLRSRGGAGGTVEAATAAKARSPAPPSASVLEVRLPKLITPILPQAVPAMSRFFLWHVWHSRGLRTGCIPFLHIWHVLRQAAFFSFVLGDAIAGCSTRAGRWLRHGVCGREWNEVVWLSTRLVLVVFLGMRTRCMVGVAHTCMCILDAVPGSHRH